MERFKDCSFAKEQKLLACPLVFFSCFAWQWKPLPVLLKIYLGLKWTLQMAVQGTSETTIRNWMVKKSDFTSRSNCLLDLGFHLTTDLSILIKSSWFTAASIAAVLFMRCRFSAPLFEANARDKLRVNQWGEHSKCEPALEKIYLFILGGGS